MEVVNLWNKIAEYLMSKLECKEYEQELEIWLDNSWVIPYPEKECPRSLVPLMAITKDNKKIVYPVMEYRQLN